MRKLAITISGAVSLGSYEAGVLYEVFAALKAHNLECDSAGDMDDKIFVDVITGASAGGMSATIASQKLLYAANELDDPSGNALYRPWVKEITIEALLKDNPDTAAERCVLNSSEVEEIARRALLGRYAGSVPAAAVRHPAADTAIHVGLAMTNLNGMDYGIDTSGGKFFYTKFADQVRYDVSGPGTDTKSFWSNVMDAALACGAFPFAFKDREVIRDTGDYSGAVAQSPPLQNPLHFTYVDGGVLQNEPLGLAKNIVDGLSSTASGTDVRSYLYVAPSLRASDASYNFLAPGTNYFFNLTRLISVIFNQARFQDWIQTVKVNNKIDSANKPADELKDHLLASPSSITQLPHGSPPVAHLTGRTALAPLIRARKRGLEKSFLELEQHPAIGSAGAEAWLNAVSPLSATGAPAYEFMPVDSIISDPAALASGGLYAFAGFFDERLRQHDYDLGRQNASEAIAKGLKNLGQLRNYQPLPIPAINPALAQRKLSDLDHKLRERLRDRLRDGIKSMLQESKKVGWLGRWAADQFVVKPALNDILEL